MALFSDYSKAGKGSEQMSEILDHFPSLKTRHHEPVLLPVGEGVPQFRHIIARFPGAVDLAEAAACVTGKKRKGADSYSEPGVSTLAKEISSSWKGRQQTVCSPTDRTSGSMYDPEKAKHRLCHIANQCVCGQPLLLQRYAKTIAASKREFPASGDRPKLIAGDAVTMFVGKPSWQIAGGAMDIRFFHMSDIKLLPYRLLFLEMKATVGSRALDGKLGLATDSGEEFSILEGGDEELLTLWALGGWKLLL